MSTSSAIELLRKVILSPDCDRMNRSSVKGFLGELLVKERLESENIKVKHLGNQNSVHLQFCIDSTEINVDVKMSMLKDEFKWGFNYWGWALIHASKKNHSAVTHFVCIGVSESLEIEAIFVVRNVNGLEGFPSGIRQFSKVTHGLVLQQFQELPEGVKQPDEDLYRISRQLLESHTVVQVARGQRLRDSCVFLQANPQEAIPYVQTAQT